MTGRLPVRPVAMARVVAGISLLAVGAVHVQQYAFANYSTVPTIGPLFLLNFIGGTVLGIYFLFPAGPRAGRVRFSVDAAAAVTGCIVAGGALIGLLVSEHTPLFGFMEHGYRFAIGFAIASEAVATLALTAFLALNRAPTRAHQTPWPPERRLTLVRTPDTTR